MTTVASVAKGVKAHIKNRESVTEPYPEKVRSGVRGLMESGMSAPAIAEKTGLSSSSVYAMRDARSAKPKKKKRQARRMAPVQLAGGIVVAEIQYNDGPTAKISGSPSDIQQLLAQLANPN
jgi:transposase